MLAPIIAAPISGIRLSSVVPAKMTADENKDHRLTNMDLALKLHYIRGVYIFRAEATQGLTVEELKKPMFPWLGLYYSVSGRIRRSETGRPFIKCNDSGVRIVEAFCDKTIDELMEADHHDYSFLAYDQILGPDLGFSPLVYVQFTFFKCGGLSVGLSWAHVLGDMFSASAFINMLGQFIEGHVPLKCLHVPNVNQPQNPPSTHSKKPLSLKRVDPVEDRWLPSNHCKMETHGFHFTADQLDNLASDISGLIKRVKISHFEIICALIWKSLSKIRKDSGPRIVTICSRISSEKHEFPSNNMLVFSTVEADPSVAKGGVDELAALIAETKVEENRSIEEMMESENEDYITYGANLTFVNMEQADIYGLKLKGHRPIFANYSIKGVGDEGAVLVFPSPPDYVGDQRKVGKAVTAILPGNQAVQLKDQLKEWGIF